MYAPKLRDMTVEERWAEGFAYRINDKAEQIAAEIKAMVQKARLDLGLIQPVTAGSIDKPPLQNPWDGLRALGQDEIYARHLAQMQMATNVPNPWGQLGGASLQNLGMAGVGAGAVREWWDAP